MSICCVLLVIEISHLETPANGQAVVLLTGLLEVFISEILFWQQYRTTLSVIKPYKSGQINKHNKIKQHIFVFDHFLHPYQYPRVQLG